MTGATTVNETAAANDSVASGQVIASIPVTISGSISSTTDTDYYKVTIPGGKKVTAKLTAGSASGFGMGIYLATGQQLMLMNGVVGVTQQAVLTNSGTASVTGVFRVLRSAGSTGAYTLALTL